MSTIALPVVTPKPMNGAVHRTPIEWCDYAVGGPVRFWNPEKNKAHNGCVKHGRGCLNCYAEAITVRFGGVPYDAASMRKLTPFLDESALQHMRTFRPKGPYKGGRARPAVFLGDMTDLLGSWVKKEWITTIRDICAERADVDWLWLSKRPERYMVIEQWPDNCWTGASVSNQKEANRVVPALLRSSTAAIRFVSLEPQEGPVDFSKIPDEWDRPPGSAAKPTLLGDIDWVIQGGESGPGSRKFNTEWARFTRDQCIEAGTAYFLKQWGSKPYRHFVRNTEVVKPGLSMKFHHIELESTITLQDPKGGDMQEWDEDLRIREWPRTVNA